MSDKAELEKNENTNVPSATAIYDKFFSNLETLSGIAEKGASHSLLTIGMAVIAIALLTKIKVGNYSVLYLDTPEFIVFISIGFLLMLSAAIIRLYTFKVQMEMEKERNRLGADLLKGSQESAQELTKKNEDIVEKTGV
jgi:hypothetical protein